MGLGLSPEFRRTLLIKMHQPSPSLQPALVPTAASRFLVAMDTIQSETSVAMLRQSQLRPVLKIQACVRGALQRLRYRKFRQYMDQHGQSNSDRKTLSSYGSGALAPLREWMNLESRHMSALEILSKTCVPIMSHLDVWNVTLGGDILLQSLKTLPAIYDRHLKAFSDLMDSVSTLSSLEGINPLSAIEQKTQTLTRLLWQRCELTTSQYDLCRHAISIRSILERVRRSQPELDALLRGGAAARRRDSDQANPLRSLDMLDLLLEPFNFLPKLRFTIERIVVETLSIPSPHHDRSGSIALATSWSNFACAASIAMLFDQATDAASTNATSALGILAPQNPFSDPPRIMMTLTSNECTVTALNILAGSSPASSATATTADATTIQQSSQPYSRVALLENQIVMYNSSSGVQPFYHSLLDDVVLQFDPLPAAAGSSVCLWGPTPKMRSKVNCILVSFANQIRREEFAVKFMAARDAHCAAQTELRERTTWLMDRLALAEQVMNQGELHQLLSARRPASPQQSSTFLELWEALLMSLGQRPESFINMETFKSLSNFANREPSQSLEAATQFFWSLHAPQRSCWQRLFGLLRKQAHHIGKDEVASLDEFVAFVTPWLCTAAFLERNVDANTMLGATKWIRAMISSDIQHRDEAEFSPPPLYSQGGLRASTSSARTISVFMQDPIAVLPLATVQNGSVVFTLSDFKKLHHFLRVVEEG
jgi:hypothetical protein